MGILRDTYPEALRHCICEGSVHACDVVWAETAMVFPAEDAFNEAIATLGIEYSAITAQTALLTANAWRQYRQSGGNRQRVVADFLIGAHALTQCERLLTRDRGFYRNYFSALTIIDPTNA